MLTRLNNCCIDIKIFYSAQMMIIKVSSNVLYHVITIHTSLLLNFYNVHDTAWGIMAPALLTGSALTSIRANGNGLKFNSEYHKIKDDSHGLYQSNCLCMRRMISYSFFKSSFCHVTSSVSMTRQSIYLRKTLRVQQTTFTLQNLSSKGEADAEMKQDYQIF